MNEMRETWTDNGERFAVIDYDQHGVAQVRREVLHGLLERAGFVQAEPPPPPEPSRDGLERLRAAHLAAHPEPTAARDGDGASGGGRDGE